MSHSEEIHLVKDTLSLLEHMKTKGYIEERAGDFPTVTVVRNPHGGYHESAFCPSRRSGKGRTYPIENFMRIGDLLVFPSTMKLKLIGPLTFAAATAGFMERPFWSLASLMLWAWTTVFSNMKELNKTSWIEGWVCEHSNPPFAAFPFDTRMRIDSIATSWLDLVDERGRSWRLGTVALTAYDQLQIYPRQAM